MFKLGACTITPAAMETLERLGIASCDLLDVHREGLLWSHAQRLKNLDAIRTCERVLSSMPAGQSRCSIWIITEADRRNTTIILSDEY
ncbi:hypothetical protein E4188_23910 (plasmid) [Aeromonas media]|uniref:Type I restriction endonuclease subunit M n=1 Tax=Aeromonas media TaxID=651 RepID=A0ABX6NYT0_AERME|nr:hypothetical protein CE456_00890 [Aeromonas salmonicida]QJT41538.1 hypothetical protein E4188_23910 [Aeromonas media]